MKKIRYVYILGAAIIASVISVCNAQTNTFNPLKPSLNKQNVSIPSQVEISKNGIQENNPRSFPETSLAIDTTLLNDTISSKMNLFRSNPNLSEKHLMTENAEIEKFENITDLKSTQQINAERIYSEKYKKKLYDSLGLQKADSMLKVVKHIPIQETSEEDLINRIVKSPIEGTDINYKEQSLNSSDEATLNQLKQTNSGDLSQYVLPGPTLQTLMPVLSQKIDSKYIEYADSVEKEKLKLLKVQQKQKDITTTFSQVIVKDKPTFKDKMYFEGIIGFNSDTTFNIVQFSPALAFYLAKDISLGLGPNLSVQWNEKHVTSSFDFRAFAKYEFWSQRLYAQGETNILPIKLERNVEVMKRQVQTNALIGLGGILPVFSKLGINVACLYNLNGGATQGSPWVIRVGLSSIKDIKK